MNLHQVRLFVIPIGEVVVVKYASSHRSLILALSSANIESLIVSFTFLTHIILFFVLKLFMIFF